VIVIIGPYAWEMMLHLDAMRPQCFAISDAREIELLM
jgi:hypothetical protein